VVRREAQRLEDILRAIQDLRRFTSGMDARAFLADRTARHACAAALTTVGEAVKHLPRDLCERHPDIAWADWAGLRDVPVHQYFRIDQQRIWRIIERDLAPLERVATEELRRALGED
jgi:uncharacterized protein with HEPN domain